MIALEELLVPLEGVAVRVGWQEDGSKLLCLRMYESFRRKERVRVF